MGGGYTPLILEIFIEIGWIYHDFIEFLYNFIEFL